MPSTAVVKARPPEVLGGHLPDILLHERYLGSSGLTLSEGLTEAPAVEGALDTSCCESVCSNRAHHRLTRDFLDDVGRFVTVDGLFINVVQDVGAQALLLWSPRSPCATAGHEADPSTCPKASSIISTTILQTTL